MNWLYLYSFETKKGRSHRIEIVDKEISILEKTKEEHVACDTNTKKHFLLS